MLLNGTINWDILNKHFKWFQKLFNMGNGKGKTTASMGQAL
jgi:hypothetical protein